MDVWMNRALHRNPARRFQSAKGLSDALRSAGETRFEEMALAA
jgi:hypothetical protein